MNDNLQTVMLHVMDTEKLNGPNSVIKIIRESLYLQEKYTFKNLVQPGTSHTSIVKAIKIIFNVRKQIIDTKPKFVLVKGLDYSGLLVSISCFLAGVRSIVVVHGFAEDDMQLKKFKKFLFRNCIEPLQIILSTKIYTVCKISETKPVLQKFAKERLYGTIYNCIPMVNTQSILSEPTSVRKEYGIMDDEIVVAVVGRVVENKGHQYIIEAWKDTSFDDLRLIIIGDGPFLEKYEEILKKQISEKKVILTGQRNDVTDILKDVDIFLFATLHENLSMAVLEAAIRKCAIIATNVGGNPEIIENNQNGILIPPFSAEAIKTAVKILANNEDLRIKLGKNAYETALTKFSIEKFEREMECIFNAI